jgi:alpha-glucosidase
VSATSRAGIANPSSTAGNVPRSRAEDHVSRTRADDPSWWRNAVFYQIYPRSFFDADGDGNGDLAGITAQLPYLADLGVDAVWISPFYRSPMVDNGYDISDPCDVDPVFGTLADFDTLVAEAHRLGILVTIDLVPNHLSDQHPWFREALAAGPGSAARDRFIFRDGHGPHGELPPNNWISAFGGSAWTRVADGQWYLHLFAAEQPDLNWENPDVPREFARIIRFWLDRGADGFRMDVAHGMAKPDDLPDMTVFPGQSDPYNAADPRFNQPHVHDYLRGMRAVLDEYPGAMVIGEAWVGGGAETAKFVRPDELHLSFNFAFEQSKYSAADFRAAIDDALSAFAAVGAPCAWVLSNHDVMRHATRYGGGEQGAARGRLAALIQLGLPGVSYIYNGDELGLENVELPDSVRQDPTFFRTNGADKGRDGARVPLPWSGTRPPFGFTAGKPWLPLPAEWAGQTVAAELADPASTLALYRTALRLRHTVQDLRGTAFEWVDGPDGTLAFQRGTSVVVAANMTDEPAPLPAGEVLISSAPLAEPGVLPANTAVWLRTG